MTDYGAVIKIGSSKSNNQELTVFEIELFLLPFGLIKGTNLIEQIDPLSLPVIHEFEMNTDTDTDVSTGADTDSEFDDEEPA